jgi:hypothetical protein
MDVTKVTLGTSQLVASEPCCKWEGLRLPKAMEVGPHRRLSPCFYVRCQVNCNLEDRVTTLQLQPRRMCQHSLPF